MTESVFVTGGSRGIGLATARRFRAAGARVAVCSRAGGDIPDLLSIPCDVTSPLAVENAFATVEHRHGPVTVLVANAGVTRDGLLGELAEEDFTAVAEVNLTGVFTVVRRAVPAMIERGHGRIILISSVVGLMGAPGQTNYCATKSALIGMGRSLARELADAGITVNIVSPGLIETEMTAELSPRRRRDILAAIPLGRAGTADEVARAVQFLASADAAYITGAVLPVSGGLGLGH
ncbi:3-oxoacyl-ACP reductase FabG [Nocardia sp. CDC159]|uniref:3-oxoacyl-[acyl-carrier-protein] reductase MabA n=1 Tax=Nocardia pulmonis TaxID=2951408 RepID=A0A9X2IWH0_9NOCA|nr:MULTISPECIES: 3-oxoacyl-ACP reductase FabG [Nocardia]MCM6774308.1 3-oxoacyl-ACP reductase FabG [Nocardia pulmonis]MCM6787626.1 3-oxoacyl-ACP reductase FabG [Nocardia sp. CDC159]